MKKSLLAVLVSGLAYSQVGINTQTPKSTLDVMVSPIGSKPEGIIAPRITGDALRAKNALYTADQNAALVYVTVADTAPAGKTINVTSPGYYYFDATNTNTWIKLVTYPEAYYFASASTSEGDTQNINVAVDDPTPAPVYLEFSANRLLDSGSGVTANATSQVFTFNNAGTYKITVNNEITLGPSTTWTNFPITSTDFWMDMAMFLELDKADGTGGFARVTVTRTSIERDDNGDTVGGIANPLDNTTSLTPVSAIIKVKAGDRIRVGVERGAGSKRTGGNNAYATNGELLIENISH